MQTNLPPANLTPGFVWLFLSPIGRLGRKPYWLGLLLLWIVVAIAANMWARSLPADADFATLQLSDFVSSNPLFPFLFLLVTVVELALVIKRLQDIGLPGLLALLAFVPVINVIGIFAVGFIPSSEGPNRYGPEPNSYFRRG
ncbi:DUF805 domain-containing protein [Microvirga tunisiensis]|uniref:DUF805 domain-containing protein n=2 Tax=Pannonibacter tanglangensis TaxID=2750084 RepID=A0ABW9ZJT2_9HYPH|nr:MULTISPECIES: DUF805 domain-containing protein [unclassified Pannonibacter]NBN64644.1 DUF805 domain-containing protein [Pannonibacter sp. XCT-34]NBN79179.1 DUF805 domain-containing protein [Pannonibacter sp. XCT-53]